MFCHLKYISFYLTIKVHVFLSLVHVTDIEYFHHVYLQARTVRHKPLRIFKYLRLDLTIFKVPNLPKILKGLEMLDLPRHTTKYQYHFVWYVKTISHVYVL